MGKDKSNGIGRILKCTIRTDKSPLFLMVLGCSSPYQFSAVVLYDPTSSYNIGDIRENWVFDKDRWGISSFSELALIQMSSTCEVLTVRGVTDDAIMKYCERKGYILTRIGRIGFEYKFNGKTSALLKAAAQDDMT